MGNASHQFLIIVSSDNRAHEKAATAAVLHAGYPQPHTVALEGFSVLPEALGPFDCIMVSLALDSTATADTLKQLEAYYWSHPKRPLVIVLADAGGEENAQTLLNNYYRLERRAYLTMVAPFNGDAAASVAAILQLHLELKSALE